MADKSQYKDIAAFKGRLSFHTLDIDAALAEKAAGPFAVPGETKDKVSAHADILLTAAQYEKLKTQAILFLEDCAKLPKGENNALDPKDAKMLIRQIEADESRPLNTPFKEPSDKTIELMPDCVGIVKLLSKKGRSLQAEAIVRDPAQLAVPDPDIIDFKHLQLPIAQTKLELYNGCWVIAPLSLYTYKNGANPGISAQGSYIIFQKDDTPFSGGMVLDKSSIFALDEDD